MKLIKCLFVFTPLLFSLQACNQNPIVAEVIVTLDPDGGTITHTTLSVKKGTKYSDCSFDTPTKTDCTFNKWTFSDSTEIPTDYIINENITFKANYILKPDEEYIKSLNISPIKNTSYLYEATFTDGFDYDEGRKYLDEILPAPSNGYFTGGSCSSVYNNGYFGRNFDWKYGTLPEFVVRTKAIPGKRHGSIGVSFAMNLPNSKVNKSDAYHHRMIPFTTMDGMNDAGLCVSINEVDKADVGGRNAGSNPGKPNLNCVMLVRYLLDNASNIEEAKALLATQNVYTSKWLNEEHFMIADGNGKCAEIEFEFTKGEYDKSKAIKFIEDDGVTSFKSIATNFTLLGYKGDYKNWTDANSSIQAHGCGVERYGILYNALYGDNKVTLNSLDDTLDLMEKVYYTKSYTNEFKENSDDFWFSEFNWSGSGRSKTTARTSTNYMSTVNYYRNLVKNKIRSDGNNCYYNALHSVAYDLKNKKMSIIFEENKNSKTEFSI